MLLREYIMVVCRNAGRYFKIANRSDFYHDFLTRLYASTDFPAFYNNRVACLLFYRQKFGFLPELKVNDENKADKYIYYFNCQTKCIESTTIRETIMRMYNPENHYDFALKSLKYSESVFHMFETNVEHTEVVNILLDLSTVDFSRLSGEEQIDSILDSDLQAIIQRSYKCRQMFGMNKPQDRIEQKRRSKKRGI